MLLPVVVLTAAARFLLIFLTTSRAVRNNVRINSDVGIPVLEVSSSRSTASDISPASLALELYRKKISFPIYLIFTQRASPNLYKRKIFLYLKFNSLNQFD